VRRRARVRSRAECSYAQGGTSIAATAPRSATASRGLPRSRSPRSTDRDAHETLAPTERRVATLGQSADERRPALREQYPGAEQRGRWRRHDVRPARGRTAPAHRASERRRPGRDGRLEAAIGDLSARRDQLQAVRGTQAQNLQYLTARREALDAQLASLSGQAAHAAEHSRLTASVHTDSTPAPTAAPTGSDLASVSPPTEIATVPVAVTAPTQSAAVSPHHNEPFLVCTRARVRKGKLTGGLSAQRMY
jgi:hypothetical protein